MVRKDESLAGLLDSGGTRRSSGTLRLMHQPRLRQVMRSTAAELGHVRCCGEEDEDEEPRGEMKRIPIPIYKAVDRWHTWESRRLKNGYVTAQMPRF